MGRKSRRNPESTPVATLEKAEVFPTAIYARLSVENSGKDDGGASIENQIDVCKEYISEMPDLELIQVYSDNGWTGTVMHRPAFDELMADVESGLIKAVVVRDLSRFARNYIEMGTYLESIFPELNVRFISVKERFDTFNTDGTNNSLMIPLQSLINDLYSKDISRKVEAALRAQRIDGTFKWKTLPYGYKWNESHTGIIPDPERAPFVKRIFEWRAEGISVNTIAQRLKDENAPRYLGKEDENTEPWRKGALCNLMRNPVYAGDRVLGRSHSAIYKGIKKKLTSEEEWVVFPDTHEAIVSRELFEKVQDIYKENSRKRQESIVSTENERRNITDLFSGKAFCAECGSKMYFRRCKNGHGSQKMYGSYYCSLYHLNDGACCTCHGISKKALENIVLEAIHTQVKTALDYERLIRLFRNSSMADALDRDFQKKAQESSRELKCLQAKRKRLYEDYVDGLLNESEYLYAKERYEEKYVKALENRDALMEKRKSYEEAMSPENKWVSMLKSIRNTRKLSQGMVDAVVEKVLIHESRGVELILRYHDVFELTEECLFAAEKGGQNV